MTDSPTDVVKAFCDSWGARDIDAIVAAVTDDAVYHNIPMDPVVGPDAIRSFIEGFTTGVDKIEFRMLNMAANGNVVFTERVDVFTYPDRTIELPVAGVFEIRGGKIAAWRDYFDVNMFTSQMAPAEG
ncbi:MAG TPA: limonene-1,2-epoxide hydrolase family protein [Acidimicrobiia bacterium]|nr:limonene-1,2-epoxide hydrolase family protein [Acidimicrobiia bacterium]